MRILAVDLGGVAHRQPGAHAAEMLASPAGVIVERNREQLAQKVAQEAERLAAEEIVLGLPRNMDGSEGESAQGARAFADLLAQASGLKVVLRDERGTTLTAHGYLNQTNTRGKKRKAVVDSVAATVILQDYLDFRRNMR